MAVLSLEMTERRRPLTLCGTVVSISAMLLSTACAYALPAVKPPSQERIKVVAASPQAYVLRIDTGHSADLQVPTDGRISLSIPPYRPGCRVYLFNWIKVSDGHDPLKDWTLQVNRSGETVRTLSLRQVMKLATDSEGYRLLRVTD